MDRQLDALKEAQFQIKINEVNWEMEEFMKAVENSQSCCGGVVEEGMASQGGSAVPG
jgi:hypothetical protein